LLFEEIVLAFGASGHGGERFEREVRGVEVRGGEVFGRARI
jgi:hypothetical protein